MYMTHGQVIQVTACRTYQCGSCINQATQNSRRGSGGLGGPLQYVETPGIPLCERSKRPWQTSPGARSEGCIYRQIIPKPYSRASSIFTVKGATLKRNCHPSLRSLLIQRATTWPRRMSERLSWSTALIDFRSRSLGRPISSWFQTKSGQQIADMNV